MTEFKRTHVKLTKPDGSAIMLRASSIQRVELKPAGSSWPGGFSGNDYSLIVADSFAGLVTESVDEIYRMCTPVMHVPIEAGL
jgi:hypothetical protein